TAPKFAPNARGCLHAAANRRSLVLIGAAMALPILLLVVIQLVFAFTRESEELEQRTLSDAELVVELVDSRIDADFRLMEALASAEQVRRRNWPAAYVRAREIAALNPHWRNVIVSDLAEGREILSTVRPLMAPPRPLSPAVAAAQGNNIGGVVREGEACPCVHLHLPIEPDGRYLLSVALDPAVFQNLLTTHASQSVVAALVDRDGLFVARSAEFEDRVGTPATPYVREAIA